MNPIEERKQLLTRRSFLSLSSTCLGAAALNTLMNEKAVGQESAAGGLPGIPHFAPKAKRVIYLFQSGGPSQHELWTTNQNWLIWSAMTCHRLLGEISALRR